jgi:ABC-type antimicrobial peptide transport system permease subunit
MILREALLLHVVGLIAGTALAIAAGRAAQTMLLGLKPVDPSTLVFAVVSLAFIAVAASVLPAARATAVDPMQVPREE